MPKSGLREFLETHSKAFWKVKCCSCSVISHGLKSVIRCSLYSLCAKGIAQRTSLVPFLLSPSPYLLSDLEPKLKSNYQSAEEACISLLGGFPLWFSNKDLLLSHHCLASAAASMLRPLWDIITSLWFPSVAGSCALEKILSGNKEERDIPETQLCWVVIHCFMERNLSREAHVLLFPRPVELEGERSCTKTFCRESALAALASVFSRNGRKWQTYLWVWKQNDSV